MSKGVVYATSTCVVTMPGGWTVLVPMGSHWPADDPLVRFRPDLFTDSPEPGLHRTSPAPAPATRRSRPKREEFRG